MNTSKPTLLLLHGFMGQPSDWDFLKGEFPNAIIPDLHARMDVMPKLATSIVDELPMEKIIVVGYSMGARLALYLALTYPDRFQSALIISGSPGLEIPIDRQQRRTADAAWIHKLRTQPFEQFLDDWYVQPIWCGQKFSRLDRPELYVQALEKMGLAQQASLWSQLPNAKIPVTFMAGELDVKFMSIAKRMHQLTPNSVFVMASGLGHNIPASQEGSGIAKWIQCLT